MYLFILQPHLVGSGPLWLKHILAFDCLSKKNKPLNSRRISPAILVYLLIHHFGLAWSENVFFSQIRVATFPLGLCVLLKCSWNIKMPERALPERALPDRACHRVPREAPGAVCLSMASLICCLFVAYFAYLSLICCLFGAYSQDLLSK